MNQVLNGIIWLLACLTGIFVTWIGCDEDDALTVFIGLILITLCMLKAFALALKAGWIAL